MSLVDKILDGKSLWSISPEDTVYDAIKLMDEKGVGALTVVQDGKLVGIISERDYARKVILKDRSSKSTLVKDIMTKRVLYASPSQKSTECLAMMNHHRIRHLPVKQNDELVGIVSIGDVVRDIIDDQEVKIKELEHYFSWEENY